MPATTQSDFTFSNQGSLFLVTPNTEAAKTHLKENTGEEVQWWAGALVVEPRYARDLADCLLAEGFSVD